MIVLGADGPQGLTYLFGLSIPDLVRLIRGQTVELPLSALGLPEDRPGRVVFIAGDSDRHLAAAITARHPYLKERLDLALAEFDATGKVQHVGCQRPAGEKP